MVVDVAVVVAKGRQAGMVVCFWGLGCGLLLLDVDLGVVFFWGWGVVLSMGMGWFVLLGMEGLLVWVEGSFGLGSVGLGLEVVAFAALGGGEFLLTGVIAAAGLDTLLRDVARLLAA